MQQLIYKLTRLILLGSVTLCSAMIVQVSLLFASELNFGTLSEQDVEHAAINQCFQKYSHPNSIDLCVLDKALIFIHPNVYFSIGRTIYSQRIKQLQKMAPSLTKQQFSLNLAELVAQLNDAHTYVDFTKIKHTTSPISLKLIHNKIQLDNATLNTVPQDSLTLVAVNDHNAITLVEHYSKYFPDSNKQPDKQKATRDLLTLYSLNHPNKKLDLQVQSTNGNIFQVNLARSDMKVKVKVKEKLSSSTNMQCQVRNFLILKIKQFNKIKHSSCLEKFQKIISNKEKQEHYSLIIDLRDNFGGDADVAKELSHMIFGTDIFKTEEKARLVTNLSSVREPLTTSILTIAREKGHISQQQLDKVNLELNTLPIDKKIEAEIALIQGSYNNVKFIKKPNIVGAPGYLLVEPESKSSLTTKHLNLPIYILTNKNTRSAAALFALYAQKHLAAKLIGTGIGGDRRNFASSLNITLPNSKLPIYIATAYLINNHIEHYQDIVWPSAKDTAIQLDRYVDSESNETPVEIIESLFSQPLRADKANTIQQGVH